MLQHDQKKALTQYRAGTSDEPVVVRDGIVAVSQHLPIPVLSDLLEVYA